MKNPTMVYRYPGSKTLGYKHGGDIYDHKVVDSHAAEGKESELDAALANGWFPSPAEAKAGVINGPADEIALPTRKELEEKAAELGIEFNKRSKDEALLEKINTALAKQGS